MGPGRDIVVTSTGATSYLLTRAMMAPILRARRYRPLFLVDLSVPRNIEPSVHDLEGAYLFNVDVATNALDPQVRPGGEELGGAA